MRICYAEQNDTDFIRWTSNLLRAFIQDGSVQMVRQTDRPNLMLASVWRPHPFPDGLPVVLVSNENWRLFRPHFPLSRYKAVIGIYPPEEACSFIRYPFGAVYLDTPVGRLYEIRGAALRSRKSHFCCFVSSNGSLGEFAEKRVHLFRAIDAWRSVDSAGRVANNTGWLAPRGAAFLDWISRYKYMICPENSYQPGYITEKPFMPWFAGTIPIYAGGEADSLNQAAIVNASRGDVLAQLEALEADPASYEEKRHAELVEPRISLRDFEQNFRRLVLQQP